jgi:hypothetical protein
MFFPPQHEKTKKKEQMIMEKIEEAQLGVSIRCGQASLSIFGVNVNKAGA